MPSYEFHSCLFSIRHYELGPVLSVSQNHTTLRTDGFLKAPYKTDSAGQQMQKLMKDQL